MNSTTLYLLESATILLLSAGLLLSYLLRHAAEGFQHRHLFYFGAPPENFIPIEARD